MEFGCAVYDTCVVHIKRLVWLISVLVLARPGLWAETVKGLPAPTGYVNDFAGVIDPATKQQIEALCTKVDQQAHAQIAVVTIKSLEGTAVEDFANQLEEKWKVGAKGTDRGILMLFSVGDRKRWIEVGYGLEGILNDAKVGDIGRSMVPLLQQGQYGPAMQEGVQQIAQVIAADAHVSLATQPQQPQYYEQPAPGPRIPVRGIIILLVLIAIIVFHGGGGSGWMFFLLGNILGGGGGSYRGGGFGDGEGGGGGGGFGGFGGGGSGGGGAGGGW